MPYVVHPSAGVGASPLRPPTENAERREHAQVENASEHLRTDIIQESLRERRANPERHGCSEAEQETATNRGRRDHECILAPLCQAVLARGVEFGVGPGCGLSEAPAVGVGSATLAVRVVPACPPGPTASCASATSWR